jgi:phosphate transport system protein
MQTHFDKDLSTLKEKLLIMAAHSESAVNQAVKSLVERDEDLAFKVRGGDNIVDRFEIEVDEMAIALLAKAPLASHLRLITVAMKISHNLERVADEATTISRRAIKLAREAPLNLDVDIPVMAEKALKLLKDSLDAFVKQDSRAARDVIPRDKEVDKMHKGLQKTLAARMMASPETVARCLHLMVVAKSLERIADHATNIAEEVVYLCEAADIRHIDRRTSQT